MREDGVGTGGAACKGRHGIRYERTHSDTWLEDIKTEVGGGVRVWIAGDVLGKVWRGIGQCWGEVLACKTLELVELGVLWHACYWLTEAIGLML